ncbi:MAG TPA: DNA mismatch repair endonuclease MutL [Candidatus Hypogeohydataceae bacterium YC38]
MSRIHLLTPTIVNKIAAGEVIERPASVVKELVENSIDADSTRIEVGLVEAGKTLIRVVDNGVGMGPEDLSMVFLKHATSKINSLEDLEGIATMGFRGEALASIGAVSQARIVSCARGSAAGAEIEVGGGNRKELKYVGAPEGTQVEVRELFYNVPARRKFLKATPTEMVHISEVLTRIAMSHPEIHFLLVHNDREVFNLPSASGLRDRIGSFFGEDLARDLIPLNSKESRLEVAGYALPPAYCRNNTRMQFIFLNGRSVRDSNLTHAINEAYRNLLSPGRFPFVFLSLRVDPGYVDVNVHPTKMEVRFREPAQVHAQVLQALRKALNQFMPSFSALPKDVPRPVPQGGVAFGEAVSRPSVSTFVPKEQQRPSIEQRPFLQLHGYYIVEETPGGINIIDQHALHEAMLYQEIQKTIQERALPSQRLLIPELLELSPEDFFTLIKLKPLLDKLGLEVEEFGRNSIIVRAVPQVLKDLEAKEFVSGLLENIHEGELNDHILDGMIKVMACKGAIKSGRRLTPYEVHALLEKREETARPTHCPHGRPTTLFFSLEELDKQFKRRGK